MDNVLFFVIDYCIFGLFFPSSALLMLGLLFLTFQQMLGNFMMVVFWPSWALPGRP
jgi:hypothetical protein